MTPCMIFAEKPAAVGRRADGPDGRGRRVGAGGLRAKLLRALLGRIFLFISGCVLSIRTLRP
jgi:hypothetical protein